MDYRNFDVTNLSPRKNSTIEVKHGNQHDVFHDNKAQIDHDGRNVHDMEATNLSE